MSAREPRAASYPVRVYYEDTDAGGVVYHANYLKFAERARTEMLRALGIEQERLRQESGVSLVVRRMTVDFLAPARLDDELVVASRLAGLAGASLDLAQEIRRGDEPLVRLDSQIACLGPTGRPTRLPSALRAALAFLDEPSRMVSAHGR
jgi:acyl-CoA thioester hydrolase